MYVYSKQARARGFTARAINLSLIKFRVHIYIYIKFRHTPELSILLMVPSSNLDANDLYFITSCLTASSGFLASSETDKENTKGVKILLLYYYYYVLLERVTRVLLI